MALELERACYDKMERESMEYFYAAEEEIQRQRERIRQLENVLTENGIRDYPIICVNLLRGVE